MALDTTNSWVTINEADTYFSERIGASAYWVSGAAKEAALITAFRQLNNAKGYSFPAAASDNMKYGQCEQALFLLAFADEMFRRQSLQAQGVTDAGIVKEKYMQMKDMPICIQAKGFLRSYELTENKEGAGAIYAGDLTRDENEEVL